MCIKKCSKFDLKNKKAILLYDRKKNEFFTAFTIVQNEIQTIVTQLKNVTNIEKKNFLFYSQNLILNTRSKEPAGMTKETDDNEIANSFLLRCLPKPKQTKKNKQSKIILLSVLVVC